MYVVEVEVEVEVEVAFQCNYLGVKYLIITYYNNKTRNYG